MKRTLATVTFVLLGFLAGMVITGRFRVVDAQPATPVPAASATSVSVAQPSAPAAAAAPAAIPATLPDLTDTVSRVVNGVVNVSSEQIVRSSNSPFASDPFFSYFFGDDAEMFGSRSRRELSLGSGVVVSSDGYVVTNSHVIGTDVRNVSLALPDKREIRGRVIGIDPTTDIALVKVDAAGLPVVPWGDSSKLKVGEWVLAIGSPFQLSQTVTLGIVSAVGRANVGFADYEDFIQTDAAINPGNSGGALVNSRGELIGINTGILSKSGGYQGIGFAVPSNLARRVIGDLQKYGEVRRGSIGNIEIAPLTTQLAQELNVSGTNGALIWRMSSNAEAYRSGLRPGDVVVTFNGTTVEDASHFLRLLADAKIGTTAVIGVLRDAKRIELKVPIVQGSRRR